ncbi:MAG TPA: ABC transporter ATP-binding protein [Jiangellaceae bacterium]|nr:ABC transporter ATP-binding protein [Jiangellaceae bacterium]
MDDVITVDALTKRFGRLTANDAVDLRVRPGQVVGLLGHNGAGKTTLVSQLVGLLRPDAGSVRVAGIDAVAEPAAARHRIALQPQTQAPLEGLTPRLAIELAGRLRGLVRSAAHQAAEEMAAELNITAWLDQRALPDGAGISGGVRRLAAFAMAAVAPTPLIVLDEPTNDVDASRRPRLWQAVRRLGDEGAGVLLVTHNVIEAERVVDHLVVLDHGRVVGAGSPTQLRGSDSQLRLELRLHPESNHDPSAHPVPPPFPVARRVADNRRALLTIPDDAAASAVAWASGCHQDGAIEGYSLAPATLEDAYLALTDADSSTSETSAELEATHA